MNKLLIYLFLSVILFLSLSSRVIALTPSDPTNPPITPSVAPYPTLAPITPSDNPCSTENKNLIYPPNSSCYAEVKKVELDVSKYPLTCIPPVEVKYSEVVDGLTFPPTEKTVVVDTTLQDATEGFLGPDINSLTTPNPDQLAQKYLFNGLFDRPFFSDENMPRELFRTYWRMLNSRVQADLKALFIYNSSTDNTKLNYYYIDSEEKTQEIDTKTLYGLLPNCLRKFPVCDDYVEAYQKLGKDVKTQYDTLLPFDFSNSRGYLSQKKGLLAATENISAENIAYLTAILSAIQGDNGLFNFYSPSSFIKETPSFSTIPAGMERQIYPAIDSLNLSSCAAPTKSSGLPSTKTYPAPNTITQWINITPLTVEKVSTGAKSCYCGSTEYKFNEEDCIDYGCIFASKNTYKISGQATGMPITVFNNPLITSLTDLVAGEKDDQPSFYKMMLPSFAPAVEKVTVSAPAVQNSSTDPNVAVSGHTTIYRDNNLAQDAMHLLQNCWLVPGDQQTSSKCPKENTACGTVPELPIENSCSTTKNPLKLPDNLLKAIESAGSSYNVPAKLIIGVMYGESAFNPGSKFLDSAFVEENLKSCAVLPNCNPDGVIVKNIVEFFQMYWGNLKDAVKVVDPQREPNACNLLDGIFAIAKDLHQGRSGSPAFSSKTCFGIGLNAVVGTSTSCSWNDKDIETAIRVWEFGTGWNETTMSCMTKENSCATGGGMDAQCPTGGDSCETKGKLYANPSHNACIWNVYNSY